MFLRTCDSRPVWKPSPPGAPSPVEKSLREAFDQVDRTALEQRQRHPRTTRRAANCAMIALILAVTLLSFAEFVFELMREAEWYGA
jgi:hypothetical protein